MRNKPVRIDDIVSFLKTNPIFGELQKYIDQELEKERELYENSEANEFLRGRVSILKKLQNDLRK